MSQASIFLKNLRDFRHRDLDQLRNESGERHDRIELRLDQVEPRVDEAERRLDTAIDKVDGVSADVNRIRTEIESRLDRLERTIDKRLEEIQQALDTRLEDFESRTVKRLDQRFDDFENIASKRAADYEAAVDERFESRFNDFATDINTKLDGRLHEIEVRNDTQNADLTARLVERFETHTRSLDLRVDDRLSHVERSLDDRMAGFEKGIDLRLFDREKYIDNRLVRIGDDIVARTDLLLQHSDQRVDHLRRAMRFVLAPDQDRSGGITEQLDRFDSLTMSRRALEDVQATVSRHFEEQPEAATAHYFKIIEWKNEAIESLRKLTPDEQEIADYILSYVDRANPKDDDYAQTHMRRFIATLGRIPPPQKSTARLLELGSCYFFTPAIERFAGYSKISCADWQEGAEGRVETREVRQIKGSELHKYETRIFNAETDPFPYPDRSFQVVLCCEMLEHLSRDPMHLFWEANRILEADGLLLVTTPNITSIRAIEGLLTGYPPYLWLKYNLADQAQQHYHEHTPETVRTLLTAAGFTVEEMETEDVWAKSNPATIQLLQQLQFSADLRGDNIFVLARKTSPPIDRYPESLYVVQSDSHGPDAVSVQDKDA